MNRKMTIQEILWQRYQRIYKKVPSKIIIIWGVGGRMFPNDYNWICPLCGSENRSWELKCSCSYDKSSKS